MCGPRPEGRGDQGAQLTSQVMPLCSIITAAGSADERLALECWRSIAAQSDLGGWELEWCVQEDGAAPGLRERLPADERIRYEAAGVRYGIATTRNLALGRARGEVVRVLDQDDLLLPPAVGKQLAALAERPRAAWVVARAADLLPDGSRRLVETGFPAGVVEPGALVRAWRESGRFPVHAAGVGMRTEVARAFGGWAALPRSEDLSLLAAVSSAFPGVHLSHVDFLYRRWPGQTTRTERFARAKAPAWRSVRQRAEAVAAVLSAAEAAPVRSAGRG